VSVWELHVRTGSRRPRIAHLSIILGALLLALLAPAQGPTSASAALPVDRPTGSSKLAASTTPASATSVAEVGVMGASLRNLARLAPTSAQSTVCPSGTPLQGIDVSYYQGSAQGTSINWTQVAQSGLSFAYARAADGTGFLDPDFQTNYRGIKQVGMKAGAYLFYEPNQDPTAQANVLVTALEEAGFAAGDLEPVFDVEVTDNQSATTIAANLQSSINVVQQALGTPSLIYTSWGFWNSYVNSTAFGTDPLWVANWFVSCPGLPNGWSTWSVWQYSDMSSVSGITGNVDADESNGPTLPLCTPSAAIARLTPAAPAATSASHSIFLPLVTNNAGGGC
jgi:lysozyme